MIIRIWVARKQMGNLCLHKCPWNFDRLVMNFWITFGNMTISFLSRVIHDCGLVLPELIRMLAACITHVHHTEVMKGYQSTLWILLLQPV